MMVSNRITVLGLLGWQWRRAVLYSAAAVVAQLLHIVAGWRHLVLPSLPIAVVGGAIGIFVSFRTNSCYARWWEGRQLWGRILNTSRHLASQVLAALGDDDDDARAVVRRQIAYAHVLRCALRDQDPWADPAVQSFTTDDERARWRGDRNPASALLHTQRVALTRLCDAGRFSDLRLSAMDQSLAVLLDAQGGCERIKKTPFPRGYAFISDRLVIAFGCMLPFALVKDLDWFTVPMNLLICGAFTLIGEAGRVLEDPFTMFWNGLPLSAISATIELNLRQRMGERDVPAMPTPDARGILM